MRGQSLRNDQVLNTQLVSIEALGKDVPLAEVKRLALKAALADRAISLGQSLQVSFRLFDVLGAPMDDD